MTFSMSRKLAEEWVTVMLAQEPLATMTRAGFKTARLSFKRRLPKVAQEVSFGIILRPVHAPGYLQLVGDVELRVTGAERHFRAMMGSAAGSAESARIRTPFDSLRDRPGGNWLFRDEAGAAGLAESVTRALAGYIVPYLDSTGTLGGTLQRCRAELDESLELLEILGRTPEVSGDRGVLVAAVAFTLGKRDLAREILDKSYPAESLLRPQFATAFDYVR